MTRKAGKVNQLISLVVRTQNNSMLVLVGLGNFREFFSFENSREISVCAQTKFAAESRKF